MYLSVCGGTDIERGKGGIERCGGAWTALHIHAPFKEIREGNGTLGDGREGRKGILPLGFQESASLV
jgi:hypothetical protein